MSAQDEFDLPADGDTGVAGSSSNADDVDEAALEAMKARVAEMEAEAAKLREMQAQANNGMGGSANGEEGAGEVAMSEEDKEEVDARSIYVGNVS